MDRDDDDDGVGYVRDSHYLKSPERQAIPLLQLPARDRDRDVSISSSVSDMDIPIYSSDNLTTRPPRMVEGQKELDEKGEGSNSSTVSASKADGSFNGKLAFAIAASALGSSFQHGYNTGVLNNPEIVIQEWISTTITERSGRIPDQGEITVIWAIAQSIFCVGGMLGGASTGFVADRFGRKLGLLLNNILVVLAVVFLATAKSSGYYELIIVGRLIIGINCGLNAGLAPMYLAEISPVNLRGAVGTVYQLVITISILIAQILGLDSILGTPTAWPTLLSMTIVPAIFQMLTLPFCPESPKFLLVSRGKDREAQRALSWLRANAPVQDEMDEMRAEYEALKIVPKVTLRELISNNALRIPLIISLTIMMSQQFCGINAVMVYSTNMFKDAGLSYTAAGYATMGVGAINVVMTVVSIVLVERAGRKTLLLFGFAGMAIVTFLLMLSMLFTAYFPFLTYMCIFFTVAYVVMFASGPGSIPWFLVSELFNQSARPIATSLAVAVNWGANFLVVLGFPLLKEALGTYVFLIFVVVLILSVIFVYKKVPETKNKTVEEISAIFRQQSYQ